MNYCVQCGNPLTFEIPPGDDRPRYMCRTCGTVHYQNPKMVVGCIVEYGDRILLCRRAIEPRYGQWTIPAGYLENLESVAEGARREAFKEARANLGGLVPYRLFNIRHISQMYFIFLGKLLDDRFSAGEESLDVQLFSEKDIPWDELAFRVVRSSLENFLQDRRTGNFSFRITEILPDDA